MSLSSPGLIKAVNDAIVAAGPACNIAGEFTRDFSDAFAGEGLTAKVAIFRSGSAAAFNKTNNNYGTVDSTSDGWATVALGSHVKQTRELDAAVYLEQPNIPYWAKMAEAAGKAVSKSISNAIGAAINSTNCTGTAAVVASATLANIGGLRNVALCDIADTVVALDGAYFTDLLVALGGTYGASAEALQGRIIKNLFGFKSVVCIDGLPSGVKGALIPANSFAIAGRAVNVQNPEAYAEWGTVTDPASGLTLTVRRHGDANTDATLINVEALFGAKIIDGAQVQLIKASAS